MKRSVIHALDYAFKKGFQVHPGATEMLEELDLLQLDKIIKDVVREKSVDRDFHIGRSDLLKYLGLDDDGSIESNHRVLFDCTPQITVPEGVEGYAALFQSRFEKMRRIMQARPESAKLKTVAGIKASKSEDVAYVCGLVTDKRMDDSASKLVLEDNTGQLEGLVFGDTKAQLETIFLDQFVMAKVDARKRVVFTDILLPDVPAHKPNRSRTDAYAVLLSDLHVGSKYFLEEEFLTFLNWLSGTDPVARRVRFVLIAGDVVDGVGIFPGQDGELNQQTVGEQFERVTELLARIPKHIEVFIIPGNHDPGRRALPQPAIPPGDSPGLWERENMHMLGNPSMVELNGVKVLMFHGQSIDDIVKTTVGMEYAHPANVMKHILKGRHLSPIYGSQTPMAPEREDLLVMDDVPDVFHVGHVHVTEMGMYRDVLMVNSGAWQRQTPFQVSVGQVPTPGLAVLLNLKTFELSVKDFTGVGP